jgi:hypothetical protein
MSSWGNNDNAANSPYWAVTTVNKVNKAAARPTAANVAFLYGNTTPDVYVTDQTVGLFMVDADEIHSGGGKVTDVSIANKGSGYVEIPGVSFSGGGGSGAAATATISNGQVTNIQVTNTGSSYETVPDVTIQVPVMTMGTSLVITANDTFMYAGHSQANSAAITYNNGGGASISPLTSGNTYYVIPINANKFQVANTAADAANNVAVNILTGGNNGQYFIINAGVRATAIADKGLDQAGSANSSWTHAAHKGWNIKRVGEGGRAGRVQWETLVALSNTIGDGSDDITLPDA